MAGNIMKLSPDKKQVCMIISNTVMILIAVILIISGLSCQQVLANNNKVNIDNRQQEISLNPLGNNVFQGNMKISWNAETNPGDEDVKFTIDNLIYQREGNDSNSQFGFTRLQNNNQPQIEAKAVLIEVDGVEKGSLEKQRIVLEQEITRDEQPNTLKFKIDANEINWSELPPGIYKGDINIHPGDIALVPPAGSDHNRPKLVVEVSAAPKLLIGENEINWAIEEPARKVDQYSDSIAWRIDNISDDNSISVQFSSEGGERENYRNLTDEDYKDFFEYVIYQQDYENSTDTFSPGERKQVSLMEGNLRLKYIGEIAETSWQELQAGNYHDIVKITISAD